VLGRPCSSGRVILDARRFVFPVSDPGSGGRLSPRFATPTLAGWSAGLVIAVFVVPLIPAAPFAESISSARDLTAQRARRRLDQPAGRRRGTGSAAPGSWPAGNRTIGIEWQSMLAWDLGTNNRDPVFQRQARARSTPCRSSNMYPHSYGWQVFPQQSEQCRAGRPLPGSEPTGRERRAARRALVDGGPAAPRWHSVAAAWRCWRWLCWSSSS